MFRVRGNNRGVARVRGSGLRAYRILVAAGVLRGVHVPPLILRGGRGGQRRARVCARGARSAWRRRLERERTFRSTFERRWRILDRCGSFWIRRHFPAPYFFTPLRSASSSSFDHCDGAGGVWASGGRNAKRGASSAGGVRRSEGCRRAYRGREGRSRARTLVLEAPIVLEGSSGRSDRRAASLARASRARQCRPRHHPRVRRGDASSALRNPCLRQISQRRYPYDKSARATLDRLSRE